MGFDYKNEDECTKNEDMEKFYEKLPLKKPLDFLTATSMLCAGIFLFCCNIYGFTDSKLDAYIDDFGDPQNGRKQRWDYKNENPTTYWILLKGWNDGLGEFGWFMWITGVVSLFSGFLFYIKAVNTSKILAVFSVIVSIVSLGFNYYEIVLFSGHTYPDGWEYGKYYGRHDVNDYDVGPDFFHETDINNVVLLMFIMAIFRSVVTFITAIVIVFQSFLICKLEKDPDFQRLVA